MSLTFAVPGTAAIPLHIVTEDACDAWIEDQAPQVAAWLRSTGFTGALGRAVVVPDAEGGIAMAVGGFGSEAARERGRFHLAGIAAALPEGTYRVEGLPRDDAETEALGWLLSHYAFDRYHAQSPTRARLIAPKGVDAARLEVIAAGEALTRDLINTPANDLGPDALESACTGLAEKHDAQITCRRGADLLDQNFPLIHTVGRAASQAPRLVEMTWTGTAGESGPALALVGKGVCFDTGGLNLKPGNSMGLMKKDMGGAATVLGLAHMIMALDLPLRLRVLIPVVENSVSACAFRPGDILTARNGMTVEINNTDAEGRLVLADALAYAAEDAPDLMVSMATLTGAARVALGPDIAPYYTDHAPFAAALETGAAQVADPVWRLPFHTPYETMIEPGIADLDNAPSGGFAGSITAALFLRRFAGDHPYAHFDIYAWSANATPARPKGGVGMGARALLDALPEVLSL
jgi:leucyl aminopeptidase